MNSNSYTNEDLKNKYPQIYNAVMPHIEMMMDEIDDEYMTSDEHLSNMSNEIMRRAGFSDYHDEEAMETMSVPFRDFKERHRDMDDFIRLLILRKMIDRRRNCRGRNCGRRFR